MITKESRRNDAVIDHLILRNSPIWQVYYAVKGRKKRYRNVVVQFPYRLYSMLQAVRVAFLAISIRPR